MDSKRSPNISSMSLDEIIYKIPFKDVGHNSTSNISRPAFFCSYSEIVIGDNGLYRLQSDEELDYIQSLCVKTKFSYFVNAYLSMMLGIPGNVAAIITMATMPKSTGTFYILVLAVTDLLALILTTLDVSNDIISILKSNFTCKSVYGLYRYVVVYAHWILVLIAVERFISVQFPLKKRCYITMRRVRISTFVLSLVLAPFAIVEFVAVEYDGKSCTYPDQMSLFFGFIWCNVFNFMYSFIPGALILVFVVLVAIAICRQQKKRSLMMGHEGGQRENGEENVMLRRQRLEVQKMERAITIMMFVTFVAFLIITLPFCVTLSVFSIFVEAETKFSPIQLAHIYASGKIGRTILLWSNAINFYLYFLSARKFREHLYALIKKCCCR